ncbi:HD domain-containing phosphohydrolase [Kribbella sp.]|uniref:HD domain-containing phosphohydrolase n=1 Tax=Kribbella sp. TaxID=1871183 RepID=UPI002D3A2749|nr:HD domain-containing phosphohydrolase [Kribbella sp.]HZX05088.1 HD domain-containing phosphohydrolase [Kribbella sp.]
MGGGAESDVRLAELLGALSLGIDLAFGQPMEHVLRQCRIAMRLCELTGADEDTRAAAYYSALLVNVGCHADAHEQARWFGDDIAFKTHKYDDPASKLAELTTMLGLLGAGSSPLHRLRVGFEFLLGGHKEVEAMIAEHARLARALGEELGLPGGALDALAGSYERWDGCGWPGERRGDQIPIAARVVQLAEFAEVAYRNHGVDGAVAFAGHGAATQFDPSLVATLRANAEKVFHQLDEIGSWDAVLDGEPALRVLTQATVDAALAAIGRFVDLKSPYFLGHSEAVANLAVAAAAGVEMTAAERSSVYRAGLTAGFGRLGVSNAVWDKPRPLSTAEWERVRLVPQLGQHMLQQSAALAPTARIVGQHRERLDGSGYPGGVAGDGISRAARVVAAADSYQAMLEPRPHRAPRAPDEAANELRVDAREGRLDPEVVAAVLAAAGHRVPRRRADNKGLTNREIDVLRLVARGLPNKEIAKRLVVTPKTVGNHIEHIYTKIGVSNRAAAALFATRHGLLPE